MSFDTKWKIVETVVAYSVGILGCVLFNYCVVRYNIFWLDDVRKERNYRAVKRVAGEQADRLGGYFGDLSVASDADGSKNDGLSARVRDRHPSAVNGNVNPDLRELPAKELGVNTNNLYQCGSNDAGHDIGRH